MQASGSLFINVVFLANKAQIVEELCVEKDLPVNSCQGSCYLKQELQTSNQTQQAEPKPETSVLLVSAPIQEACSLIPPGISTKTFESTFTSKLLDSELEVLIKPPQMMI